MISFLSAARDPRQRDGGGPPHKCFAQQNIGAGAIHLPRASYYPGAPTRLCLVGKNKKCFTPEIRGEALSMRSRYTCSRRAASRRLRLKTDLPCKSSVFRLALVHPRCSRRPRASMLHGSTLLARSAETPGSRATVIRADRKTGRAKPGGIFGGAWNSWPSRRACSVTSDRLCPPVMGGPHPGHPGRLGSGTARRSHRKALPPNGPLSVRGIAGSSPSLPI